MNAAAIPKDVATFRGWEYARQGDYHRNIDPNWSYTPTYLQKLAYVDAFVETLPPDAAIVDVGCGEGVLVEKYAAQGRHITGIDLNYESRWVRRGDVRCLPFADESVDALFFLDALEHLDYVHQPKALKEMRRVLRPGGRLLLSVPNLAHLNSRFRMFFKGALDRTDTETNHIGERPIWENTKIIRQAGFAIRRIEGITLTLPVVYRRMICKRAAKLRWLHDLLEPIARRWPGAAMLTLYTLEKESAGTQ